MNILHRSTIAVCAAFLIALPVEAVKAQDYPTKPVHIISGFGAGSAGDVLVRLLVPKLSQSTGQQFIVEYKPGAGSNIAAEFVVRAPADGYTLFLGTSANTINATFSSQSFIRFRKGPGPHCPTGVGTQPFCRQSIARRDEPAGVHRSRQGAARSRSTMRPPASAPCRICLANFSIFWQASSLCTFPIRAARKR